MVPLDAVPLAQFQRRKPAHSVSLLRDWHFLFLVSDEPDPGAAILDHRGRRRGAPLILLVFLLSRWSGGLVVRYGPRAPLIVGPLIIATGFLLFAVPGAGATYWKSFFPAFVVLGLGFAISVAPLTTVVMTAVDQNRAGAASGVNNAVARVAGVLAIATLGIVMVKLFSASLNHSLANAQLPPGVLHYLRSNEIKLAGLDVPAGLDARTTKLIQASISSAFIFGFRAIVLICAALAAASAAIAAQMIPGRPGNHREHPSPTGTR